jgi:integrase
MPAKQPPRQRWLTRAEVARLLWAARRTQHLCRFILLAVYTGSRASVIWSLTWGQLDVDRGIMHRRRSGEAEDARKRRPPVRLGRRILTHLRRWERVYGRQIPYLCHYDGVPVQKAYNSWIKARKRAGLDKSVVPHTLRHTRATWLMQAGIDPWEAAGSLGMTLTVLQATYGHHHPDWQRSAAEV